MFTDEKTEAWGGYLQSLAVPVWESLIWTQAPLLPVGGPSTVSSLSTWHIGIVEHSLPSLKKLTGQRTE